MTTHHPYAYVCTRCQHLASRHYLATGSTDTVAGPYLCSHRDLRLHHRPDGGADRNPLNC
ncbi:hypothetical protein ACSJLP_27610 [Gordonia rhizosphera NBRC 16068]|uniref:Uncharacterized protein n=1 Tax=Gordonia rhizosphera NBRC 16068 TaxID=1108045 RepID=K6W374_9ACTN|nr:hypothetical protein GORHZ_006_00400 [Gordonia rhizosphera NBRC 16068]